MKMRLLLFLALTGYYFLGLASVVYGQLEEWSTPINLSNTFSTGSSLMSVAADSMGHLHVVWEENTPDGQSRDLYYTRWNGVEWSQPTDIVITPDNGYVHIPVIAVNKAGDIYVVWNSNTGQYYSHAWAGDDTGLARSWSLPKKIGDFPYAYFLQIAFDSKGDGHIIEQAVADLSPDKARMELYHFLLVNGKISSEPTLVSNNTPSRVKASARPKMAIDSQDKIYVVWATDERDTSAGDNIGAEIYYAESSDGGVSWSDPVSLSDASLPSGVPTIAVDSSDNVHVLWYGGVPIPHPRPCDFRDGALYHRFWDGTRWSDTEIIEAQLGPDGWPDVIADQNGNVHLVYAKAHWQAEDAGYSCIVYHESYRNVYYRRWDYRSRKWQDPIKISNYSQPENDKDWLRPKIAIALGNMLYVKWFYPCAPGYPADVYLSSMRLPLPSIPARPPEATPKMPPLPTATYMGISPGIVPSPSPASRVISGTAPTASIEYGRNESFPVAIAVAATVVLILAIVLARTIWRGRL